MRNTAPSSVRSLDQAVEIVAGQAEVDAVAVGKLLALVGLAVAVVVAQPPHAWDVREVNPAVARHHTRGDAVEDVGETVGEHGREFGDAIAVTVFEQADGLGLDLQLGPVGAGVLLDQRDPVLDGACRQIIVKPRHVMPDIDRTRAVAAGFGDENLTVVADVEGDGVLELWLVGDEFDLEAGRDAELADRALGLVLGEVEVGGWRRFLGGAELGGNRRVKRQTASQGASRDNPDSQEVHGCRR